MQDPVDYMKTMPDRLLEAANTYPTVKLNINKAYIPLFTSDIIRGQSARLGTVPEDGLHAHLLSKMDTPEPSIAFSVPAPVAQAIAMDLKIGQHIRERAH